MCTKTKTSFGCGHCIKVTEACDSANCTNIDKWKFPANKDCPKCRAAGEAITRGKEGHGRHGREIRIRRSRQSSSESLPTPNSLSGSPNLSISPWALNDRSREEKKWDTPTRRKADDAWLVEHERRQSEFEEAVSKMTVRDNRVYGRSSPRGSYERVIEADEVEEPDEIESLPRSQPRTRLLAYEISQSSHESRRSRDASRDSTPIVSRELVLTKPRSRTYHVTTASEYHREPSPQQTTQRSRRTRTEFNYPKTCSYEYSSPTYQYSTAQSGYAERYGSAYQSFEQEHYARAYPVC